VLQLDRLFKRFLEKSILTAHKTRATFQGAENVCASMRE